MTATEQGDCFPVAARVAVTGPAAGRFLCHGEVTGQGSIAGVRHAHAWVEQTTVIDLSALGGSTYENVTVIDRSNGHDLELPRDVYYRLGQIDPEQVRRYTPNDAMAIMLIHEHYGPWE